MKKLLLFIFLSFSFGVFAQEVTPAKKIVIRLENNSIRIYKLALLSFEPGQEGNGTRVSSMLPYTVKEYTFPEGTALYFGNEEQVNFTMSGKNIYQRGDKPNLIVKATDAGKTFQLQK
jgi:hypothetical protein